VLQNCSKLTYSGLLSGLLSDKLLYSAISFDLAEMVTNRVKDQDLFCRRRNRTLPLKFDRFQH